MKPSGVSKTPSGVTPKTSGNDQPPHEAEQRHQGEHRQHEAGSEVDETPTAGRATGPGRASRPAACRARLGRRPTRTRRGRPRRGRAPASLRCTLASAPISGTAPSSSRMPAVTRTSGMATIDTTQTASTGPNSRIHKNAIPVGLPASGRRRRGTPAAAGAALLLAVLVMTIPSTVVSNRRRSTRLTCRS